MNISGLRKHNLPYICIWIIYYFCVVFFSRYWITFPINENLLAVDMRIVLRSINLISTGAFIILIQKEYYAKTGRVAAMFLIMGTILYLIVRDDFVRIIILVIIAISLGCVNLSLLMPFVFILNNTEKLYTILGSNLLIYIISLIQESRGIYLQDNQYIIFSFLIILIALILSLYFIKESMPEHNQDNSMEIPEFSKRIYLTLGFNFIVAILCKGVGNGIVNLIATNSSLPVIWWYNIGGLMGCIIYITIYRYNSRPFIWLGNITFSCLAMGLFCNSFIERSWGMIIASSIFIGVSGAVGMINMYYIIGLVSKKYDNMHYLKLSILFIGICGGIFSGIIDNSIQHLHTFDISMMASVISVAVMLLSIMMSPIVSQSNYYEDWAKDSENMEIDNDQLYIFKKYKLSKRELEVCILLLRGYTMRQISGILSIAYSTVNTYCTSIYRKLGINSRTELLILFKDYAIK